MRKLLNWIWKIITAPVRFIIWLVRKVINTLKRGLQSISSYFTDEEVDDTPIGESLATTIENPKALLPHIIALRKHLLRAVLAIVITTAVSFLFVREILSYLAEPISGGINELIAIDVTENIGTVMRVTLLSGFTLALPYVIFEIWLFIAPALRVSSRIKGLLAIPAAMVLFVGGMAFAFFVMLPTALPFLFNFMGLTTQPRPSSYYNFVTLIMFWIGVTFEFPLVIYLLANMGLIKAKTLASQWRLAILIIAVLSALITPTVDPVNMGLVMAPMIVLYFIGIGLAYIAQRGRLAKQKEAPSDN
ncbi:MAG: twin arginine-targeting protein translocase TatC [Chloroflexi bacterium RBG_16_47_49]|nr:MAG: twin arginine-targeting protein translocase TatC [Chloroflexi bacterium RBG_16_47_49]